MARIYTSQPMLKVSVFWLRTATGCLDTLSDDPYMPHARPLVRHVGDQGLFLMLLRGVCLSGWGIKGPGITARQLYLSRGHIIPVGWP